MKNRELGITVEEPAEEEVVEEVAVEEEPVEEEVAEEEPVEEEEEATPTATALTEMNPFYFKLIKSKV